MMKATLPVLAVFALILAAAPFAASAAHAPIKSNVFDPTTLNGPILICVGAPNGGAISNVCENLCDLVAQLANMIYYTIAAILWIITPILVTTGGLMIMLAGASPEMVGRGKKTIMGTVWGVVIVLLAWLIVSTFVAFFNIKGVGGFGTSACTVAGSTVPESCSPNALCGDNGGICPGTCDNPNDSCTPYDAGGGVTKYYCPSTLAPVN